ncbi:hypothetical protein [Paenibacillus amylolyticus]|nr:hypothetical protein [Paenibacillus amylolyticus]
MVHTLVLEITSSVGITTKRGGNGQMNYKKVEEVNRKRTALANQMLILAAKISPAMDLKEMDVIQTEIALL